MAIQKTKPPTLSDEIEKAIRRRALLMSAEPGNLAKPEWQLKNELRQSASGQILTAWARSPEGSKPALLVKKHAGNQLAAELLQEWQKGSLH